jgi:translation initiation factor 3 subunit H
MERELYKAINEPIREVELTGLVALQIVQHCRQYFPARVTGQLLGLDIRGKLEITNSFMVPERGADDKEVDPEYEVKMLKALCEVNVDNISVGWYTSTFLNQHLDVPDIRSPDAMPFLISTQFNWQTDFPNSVVLIYDHLASTHGTLGLKAVRLTKTFMDMYQTKERSFTKEKLSENNFSFNNIFEEIPLRVTVSGLQSSLLYFLEADDNMSNQFKSLDLGAEDFLQKNLEVLLSCISDLQLRQNTYQTWLKGVARSEIQQQQFLQKRRTENSLRALKGQQPLSENIKDLEVEVPQIFKKAPEPWKAGMESVLVSQRIWEHCQQISSYSGQALTKQFLAKYFEESSNK